MSRTKKGSKGVGYEHWRSRLHRHGDQTGKKTKVITHQRERAIARRELDKLIAVIAGTEG